MKDMGPVEGEDGVHSFWLSAVADGAKIKELRVQTEKEASKKANFPGFRKVSGENGAVILLFSLIICDILINLLY